MIQNGKKKTSFGNEQPPRQIDISYWKPIVCLCGNDEFDPVVFLKIVSNPLSPNECVSFPIEKMRCSNVDCALWLAKETDEKGFVTWSFSKDGKNPLDPEEIMKRRVQGARVSSEA